MSTAFRKVMLKYMILDCNFNNKAKKTKFMFGLLRNLLKNVCLEQEMLCKLRNLCGIFMWSLKMFGLLITLLNKCFSRARSSLQSEKCLIPQKFLSSLHSPTYSYRTPTGLPDSYCILLGLQQISYWLITIQIWYPSPTGVLVNSYWNH